MFLIDFLQCEPVKRSWDFVELYHKHLEFPNIGGFC